MWPFTTKDSSAHIMLDLETLGRTPGSVVIQIGACRFDPNKGIIDKFQRSIDMKNSIELGFTVDGETLAWWFEQKEEARKSVISNTWSVKAALMEFSRFVKHEDDCLWSHKDFDASIFKAAYAKVNLPFPVSYKNIYDLRTLDGIAKMVKVKSTRKREGTYHTGLDDAVYQAGVAADLLMGIMRKSSGFPS